MNIRYGLWQLEQFFHTPQQFVRVPDSRYAAAVLELLFFGLKEARACLFAALFFAFIFLTPRTGLPGVSRYDFLLIVVLTIQGLLFWLKLETWDELKSISLFHLTGFTLEVFKTHMGSWAYQDGGYTKLFGVPLFSGFMYAAVGSYVIQAWRLFNLKIVGHPPYWLASLLAVAIYLNFFTHHFLPDIRWLLAAFGLGLYAQTRVYFTPFRQTFRMPVSLAFVLIGFFIWLAENISTFFHVWQYPHQMGGWSLVHWDKWGAWTLVIVMTVTIVAHLKHIKASIHVFVRPAHLP